MSAGGPLAGLAAQGPAVVIDWHEAVRTMDIVEGAVYLGNPEYYPPTVAFRAQRTMAQCVAADFHVVGNALGLAHGEAIALRVRELRKCIGYMASPPELGRT